MIKSAFLFGGIWAATATTVALVRSPYSGEEFEVETLDSKDFSAKNGTTPFASPYLSYFAAPIEANKKFWEARFNEKRGDKEKIIVEDYSQSAIEIVSGWGDPEETQAGSLSLSNFCKAGYSVESDFDGKKEWGFVGQSDNSNWDKGHLSLWSLCSVFESKPAVLVDQKFSDRGPDVTSYQLQIRDTAPYQLVQVDTSHPFWDVRETEWRNTNVQDSNYFGDGKKSDHTIRELCKLAYRKTPADSDTVDAPTKETAVRYCGLEWNSNS